MLHDILLPKVQIQILSLLFAQLHVYETINK